GAWAGVCRCASRRSKWDPLGRTIPAQAKFIKEKLNEPEDKRDSEVLDSGFGTIIEQFAQFLREQTRSEWLLDEGGALAEHAGMERGIVGVARHEQDFQIFLVLQ